MARRILVTILMALAGSSLAAPDVQAQQGAHFHVLQVFDPTAEEIPDWGFLTRALREADVASEYAGFAAGGVQKPGDLASMKTAVRGVLHALDPSRVEEGPGFGFGLVASLQQVLDHIEMAAAADDASPAVRTHAEHVATCARNTLARVEQMFDLIEKIQAAETAEAASPLADELERVSAEVRNGRDADGDGRTTWQEGGLYEARHHMDLLVRAEGLQNGEPSGP